MSQLSRCKLTRVRKTVEETVWKDELTTICRSEDLTVPPLVGCCRWNQVPLSMSLLGFGMGTMLANFHMCSIKLVVGAVFNMRVQEGLCVLGA